MHFFDGKKGILRPKNGLVFKLMPQLAAFYLGPTPVSTLLWRIYLKLFRCSIVSLGIELIELIG
jgi:hypothetical protein